MTLATDLRDRIDGSVDALKGAIEEVADLAALVADKAMPQKSPAAFVVPLGFDASTPDAASGAFRQNYDETVGVVLVVQAPGDVKAKRALPAIDALVDSIINAVCGWAPATTTGAVFRMRRGRLLSVTAGTVIYQLDFVLQQQLRIIA